MTILRSIFQLILCVLVLFPGSGCGGGNSGTGGLEVSGQVKFANSNVPVGNLTIRIRGTDITTVTDANGNYDLKLPSHAGEVEIEIVFNGVPSSIKVGDVPQDALQLVVNILIDQDDNTTAIDGPVIIDGKPRSPNTTKDKPNSSEKQPEKTVTPIPHPTAVPSPSASRNPIGKTPNIPTGDPIDGPENEVEKTPSPQPSVVDDDDDDSDSDVNLDTTAPTITAFTVRSEISHTATVNVQVNEPVSIELTCYKADTSVASATASATQELGHTFTELEGETTYKLTVRVVDAVGNSSTADKVFTTPVALQSLPLMWTDPNDFSMSAYSENGDTVLPVIGSFGNIISYHIDPSNQSSYWVDGSRRKAFVTDADGRTTRLDTSPSVEVIGLAVDFSKGATFWIDRLSHKIYSKNPSTETAAEVAQESTSIVGLALDTVRSKVYWYTVDGTTHYISRANYDGSGKEVVFTQTGAGIGGISNLQLDPKNEKIYFFGSLNLNRVNYDGSNFETIVTSGPNFDYRLGFGLDLARQKLYFVGYDRSVRQANVDGTNIEPVFTSLLQTLEEVDRIFFVNTTQQLFAVEILRLKLSIFELNLVNKKVTAVREWSRQKPFSTTIDPNTGDIYWLGGYVGLFDWIDGIYRTSADGSETTKVLAAAAGRTTGVHFDVESGRVFYADQGLGQIVSMKPNGSKKQIHHESIMPRSLVVDYFAGKIFWSEDINSTVMKSNIDGSDIEMVSQLNATVKGVDVDPIGRKIYWAHDDALRMSHSINRMNYDGSNPEMILDLASDTYYGVNDIVIDALNDKIYWIANRYAANAAIFTADIDGNSPTKIIDTLSDSSIGIEVDTINNIVYFFEGDTGSLMAVNTDGSNLRVVKDNFLYPVGLSLDVANEKLFVTDANGVHTLDLSSNQLTSLAVRSLVRPSKLVLDPVDRQLYWNESPIDITADIKVPNQIRRANLDGTGVQPVVEEVAGRTSYYGLAFDRTSQLLFYANFNGGQSAIHSVKPDGSEHKTLLTGLPRVFELAVGMSKVFWTEDTTNKLRHCNLNGTNPTDYWYSALNTPYNVAIDPSSSSVYWSFAESYGVKGSVMAAPLSKIDPGEIMLSNVNVPGNIAIRDIN